jgi:hypothetical protein
MKGEVEEIEIKGRGIGHGNENGMMQGGRGRKGRREKGGENKELEEAGENM